MKQTKTTITASKPVVGMGSLFDKDNLVWMLIGLGVMAVGFILMAGGRSNDPNVFDKNQVYGTMRITVAPIIILAGLALEIFAIFRTPKRETVANDSFKTV